MKLEPTRDHVRIQNTRRMLMTVRGLLAPSQAGVTDAHNHVWIAPPVAGAEPGLPVLCDMPGIAAELGDYREAGGGTLVDCQPGGCGRDGRVLLDLSRVSGVHLLACTGFHLKKYYPAGHWLWEVDDSQAQAYFAGEITHGLEEARGLDVPVRAGFIKVAFGTHINEIPAALVEAAVAASLDTGVAVAVHTEKGAGAEEIIALFTRLGLDPARVVLCHMDKRPDVGLHRTLAQEGVMLVYDTFYRPKYEPDRNVWPLLRHMVADGLEDYIALATDMADVSLWSRFGGAPGLIGLFTQIVPRLNLMGFGRSTINRMVGENICSRLAYEVR